MRKILIVDDEELIRKGLKAMIERYKQDYFQIYLCSNGKEAKEILDNRDIDIIITDIRMPELDGIQLINYIKNSKKETAIIILSGYDDFNYAREALRCGAREYLLKPVNREKLYQCLDEVEKDIREKDEYIKGYYTNQFNYLIKADNISQYVGNKLSKFAGILNHYYIGIYLTNDNIALIQGLEKFQKNDLTYFVDVEGNLVVLTKEKTNLSDILDYNRNLKLIVGISNLHNSISAVKSAYLQAKEALEYRIFIQSKAIQYGEIEGRNKEANVDVSKINSIINMVGTGRKEEIGKNLDDIFNRKYIDECNLNYFKKVDQLFKDKINEIDVNLYDYENIQEYIIVFKERLLEIDKSLTDEENSHFTNLAMKRAVKYINNNYTKDINLAMIANKVNLNYTYFCELFKNYTGETYVNYVKKLRITKAKELLTIKPNYKIYEIANNVGYEDTKQFTKIFKKETGISPLEYKNKYFKA